MTRRCHAYASLAALAALAVVSCGGGPESDLPDPPPPPPPPPPPEWFVPECEVVAGPPIATYSPDAGITLRPNAESPDGDVQLSVPSIGVASEHGGLLFASNNATRVYVSSDAGCNWGLAYTRAGAIRGFAVTDRWGYVGIGSGEREIVRLGPAGVEAVHPLPFSINWLTSTPADPEAVYAVSSSLSNTRQIWSSHDLGASWLELGNIGSTPGSIQQLAISPTDMLHFVATGSGELALSFDGGRNWSESTGILKDAFSTSTHHVVFGGDRDVTDIWVSGLRRWRDEEGRIERDERFIARSTDLGLSFTDVVTADDGIALAGGTKLATRPGIAGEVLFTSPNCPSGKRTIYHYRASDNSVTAITWEPGEAGRFGSLVFHPEDPDVLYLGRDFTGSCE
ncbi:MAG: sialidase family protein [Gammaproteobacteria bacterium]